MRVTRRGFLGFSALSLTSAAALNSRLVASNFETGGIKIGMCDWNLGPACDPEMIPRAEAAHIAGIQVSVGTNPDNIPLREASVRSRYLELGKKHGVVVNSVAAGGILNNIPLKSEPQSAVYVIDAIEAAAALGAKNILMAFFAAGDLRLTDSTGQLRNVSKGNFASYELDARGVTRTVEVLKQIVPRAEDAGVILGLENTLTAEQNLEIIDRIGSKMVQVYYDVGNSTHYGYDVASEIRQLGNERICEIHLKDWETPLLESGEGEVDFAAAAAACKEIGFDKWYVLESSGRENRFTEDTQANVAFSKKLFG
ncbi:MAG: sugar phosphate isomerase/epimerase [Acidobacteriota bacterium]|nr:MAG: sugar phosphate isomerase/epimerase [Acidobacteriota bacterium]